MAHLSLACMGPLQVKVDGQPATGFKSRKVRGLLAYLAVESARPHHREVLAGLLWPDWTDSEALSNLRYALSNLRSVIGDRTAALPHLLVTRSTIQFNRASDYDLDVSVFMERVAGATGGHWVGQELASVEEALQLYRGSFLEGFSVPDSVAFEEWSSATGQRIDQCRLDAMRDLVSSYEELNRNDQALTWAQRLIDLEPWDEAAHRQLMRLLARSGRRSAALVHYEKCRQILRDELGVGPSLETTRLYEEIRKGEPVAMKAPDSGPHDRTAKDFPFFAEEAPQPESPIFVARDQELARLAGYLDRVVAGHGRIAFVTGEAGSGKTALIQRFSRQAQLDYPDLVVASGNCNAYTGIGDPYLPFREILQQLTGEVEAKWAAGAINSEHARRLWNTLPDALDALAEVGRDLIDTFVARDALLERAAAFKSDRLDWLSKLKSLNEPGRFAAPVSTGGLHSDLLEQYNKLLQALAHKRPLLLTVDDLQWADKGSINLLFHLGRHLPGNRILIIGAYRSEEVSIGRQGERHPLESVVNEFQRDFGDVAVSLRQADSRALVEALLDSEPNRLGKTFRDLLYKHTQGHPLFSIELLRGMQERGELVQDSDGRWVEGPALDWQTIPVRVEAVIEERISRLPSHLRAALRVACVEGEVFTAEVVARIEQTDVREMVQRLSSELDRRHRLIQAQAIKQVGSRRLSRYRFRNYLFQRYMYESLDRVERTYLHEDVGNVLEDCYDAHHDEIAVQLAWHFQEAGIAERAIPYLGLIGSKAVQLTAYQDGVAHLTNGLEMLRGLPESPERDSQELDLLLALMTGYQGARGLRSPEATRTFTRAHELCQQIGRTSQLSRVLEEMVEHHIVGAEYDKARELAVENLQVADASGNPLQTAICHWDLGIISYSMGEFEAAHDLFVKVLEFYEPRNHHPAFVLLSGKDAGIGAMAQEACCLWALGYPEQALIRSQESLRLASEFDHVFARADAVCFGGCLFNAMRRDATALKETAREMIELADKHLPGWGGAGQCYLGAALIMMGQPDEGVAYILEGLETLATIETRFCTTGMRSSLALGQAMAGRPVDGLDTLQTTLTQVNDTGERFWEAEIYRIRAEILLMLGNESEAEASLERAIEVARDQSAKSLELRAAIDLARVRAKQGRWSEGERLLESVTSWFTEGFDTPDLLEARTLLTETSAAARHDI